MKRSHALTCLAMLVALMPWQDLEAVAADSTGPVEVTPTISMVLVPRRAADLRPAFQLSKAQRETMRRNVINRRERIAALVDNDPPSPPGRESPRGQETQPRSPGEFHGIPNELNIVRNVLNPVAQDGDQSTILEPTTINEGNTAIYTGNWFLSYSTNGGADWTEEAMLDGPAQAPFFCCDMDTIYDPARGLFIVSALYCAQPDCSTDGGVGILIRRAAAGPNACTYFVDYTNSGAGLLPDFPRLGISNKFLYVSANALGPSTWAGADMWRVPLDDIADCNNTTVELFTYTGVVGQRAFVPGTNTQHAMYWATSENTTQLRVFKWPETSANVQQFLRTVRATTFANSNCQGGTNNNEIFTNPGAFMIVGFTHRTAVAGPRVLVLWSAAKDAGHGNAYIRGADFQEPNLVLMSQPDIFSSAHCYNHPAVVGSERDGHYGLAVLFGGKVGGGGPGLNAAVGIDDDYTPGVGVFDMVTVTTGTHVPEPSNTVPKGRVGDFVSVQRQRPCGLSAFAAAVYELNGGGDEASVRGHYVEFVRNRDLVCLKRWNDVAPGAFPP